jgi:hypothetical protein
MHIRLLSIYYRDFVNSFPTSITARIDVSTMKVIGHTILTIGHIDKFGLTSDRTTKANIRKGKKRALIRQSVIVEYHRIAEKEKTPHGLARQIQSRIKGTLKNKTPHTDTIKDYLREEGLI